MKMMNVLVVLVVGVVLAACGDGVEGGHVDGWTEENRVISQDFAGDWSGPAVLTVGDRVHGARPVIANIKAEVDGPTLDVSVRSLCGSATTTLTTKGNGREAMWYGSEKCQVLLDECPDSTVDFHSAVMKVLADGRFYLLLNGTASGCGLTSVARVEVYATR